jgi:hypothetical protein
MLSAIRLGPALALALAVVSPALAQDQPLPEWARRLDMDPTSPAALKYAAQQRERVAAERELRRIRFQHFGPIKKTEIRQEGILKVLQIATPALYPSLIEIFAREGADVKVALLDLFHDSRTPEGDAALAWMGIFDRDADARDKAGRLLGKRREALGETPLTAKLVVFQGLKSADHAQSSAAARFAANFDIIEAIPWLIAGQLQGTPQVAATGVGQSDNSALAWIMVGTQTAYVSDLQPVVGPSAVAFDPQLSVVNEGVILRVIDAVVVTYHVEFHNALIDLSSRAWGQSTHDLGWNIPAWNRWYRDTFAPYWQDKQRELAAAKAAGQK